MQIKIETAGKKAGKSRKKSGVFLYIFDFCFFGVGGGFLFRCIHALNFNGRYDYFNT